MVLESTLALAAEPLVKKIVDKLVAPKMIQFTKWCKGKYDENLIPTAGHFQEYLLRSYTKYSIINTLVFHNSQRSLREIYIDQTLVKENSTDDEEEATKIDKVPVPFIKQYKKILITDTAGMGKSTITKRMFIDIIDNCIGEVGIPIYIELNRLNKERTILNEIQEELSSLSKKFDNDLLLRLIQTGGFIFFLDGFDEISISDRNEVTKEIQKFISKAGTNNYFILTSRPEDSLSSFGDFQSFKIRPLTKDESFELLKKYDMSKKKELSEKLVELLNSGQYDTIDEYLVNPLLVSLLFTAYDFNRSIPFEKHRFYGIVFEAYFEKHDNTKALKSRDKLSGLNFDGFDSVLRYIGYDSLVRIGVKFNEDTILNSIRKAKVFCGISAFSESDFLKDLTSSVPLFCKEGTDYKWVHKSLLEYFAARFIYCDSKKNQDKILSAIYKSEHVSKYFNLLDLYFDIDPKGFSKNITLPFCESYLEFYRSNLITSNICDDLIKERISILFWGKFAFVLSPEKKEERKIDKQFLHSIWRGIDHDTPLFFGYSFHNDLYQLFIKKTTMLFIHTQTLIIDDWYPIIAGNFLEDVAYYVDMKLGDENEIIYAAINKMICPNPMNGWILDPKACETEIARIHNEIAQIENFSDFLTGI